MSQPLSTSLPPQKFDATYTSHYPNTIRLQLLRLEHLVQRRIDQTKRREGPADNSAQTGQIIVPLPSLLLHSNAQRAHVVREMCVGNVDLVIKHNLQLLEDLISDL